MNDISRNDEIFWERLEEMPDLEAEMELVARRLIVLRENAELIAQKTGRNSTHGDELGIHISQNGLQLSLLNERLTEIRRRMNRASWQNAIRAVYGAEGYEKCRAWVMMEEQG
ncbi:MAG: hypothetical protein V4621_07925 [Pseudomonadota bacterium]